VSEEKLKPCPFCGSEASHWPYGGDYHNEYINCSKCDAQIGEPVSWPAKEVIKQWNTRINPTPATELVEEVKREIERSEAFGHSSSDGYRILKECLSALQEQE